MIQVNYFYIFVNFIDSKEWSVAIKFNGKYVPFLGSPNHSMPYDDFINKIKAMINDNFDKNCGNFYFRFKNMIIYFEIVMYILLVINIVLFTGFVYYLKKLRDKKKKQKASSNIKTEDELLMK